MDLSLGIWLVRSEGENAAERICRSLGGLIHRPWQEPKQSQKEQFALVYRQHSAWILIMACGIAVRFVEGMIGDKREDPAVVVVDESCRYAIALLGGHEGGANDLVVRVSNCLGAMPVVTTATEALKPLVLGIGCRAGASYQQIEAAVVSALGERTLVDVREVATIDLKANEPGLVKFCQSHSLPLRWFGQAQVAQRPWVTEASPFVRESIGVDGVCEPCALMVSPRGRLVVPKCSLDGVAVAVVDDSLVGSQEGNNG